MDTVKRHAPPVAIAREIEAAMGEALKGQPIGVYRLAMEAVEKGLRAANAKNDAGVAGYV